MKVDKGWIGRGVKRSDGTDYFSSYMDSSKSDVQMGRTQTGAFKISHFDSTIHANPAQTRRTHRHALTHGERSLLRLKFYSLWSASLAHMQCNWRTGDIFPINSKNCWLLKWKQRTTINDTKRQLLKAVVEVGLISFTWRKVFFMNVNENWEGFEGWKRRCSETWGKIFYLRQCVCIFSLKD